MLRYLPYPSLPECLLNLVKERGVVITVDEAIEYINTAPAKKIEATETLVTIDRKEKVPEFVNPLTSAEDLRFTKILRGKLEDFNSDSWNELLRYALKLAIEKDLSLSDLSSLTNLKIKQGVHNEHGYRPVRG